MTHDKIKAAARKRMAETGESYATARREVIKNYQQAGAGAGASPASTRWFALDDSDIGQVTRWLDRAQHRNSRYGGVDVDSDVLRVRALGFRLDIPRGSVRSVAHSDRQTRGTLGTHGSRGDWLLNGSHQGLVELVIEPPVYPPRQPNTLFLRMKVNSLTISLVDPDGFIDAVKSTQIPPQLNNTGAREPNPCCRKIISPGPVIRGGATMVLQAASGRLARVLAAVCLTALSVIIVDAASASAAQSTLTLNYDCTFPLIGTQPVSVTYGANLPASATQGVPTSSAASTADITFPAQATEGLTLVGAATVAGTAAGDMSATNGATETDLEVPYTVPSTAVPASGAFTLDATGTIPSLTFPNAGTANFTVGDFSLTLTPLTAQGQPTSLGTFTSPCTQEAGQDNVLATIPVNAPASPCTTTITGTHSTQLTVASGETCLVNATQNGQVTVAPGAALSVTNSTINGTVTATGASSVTYCHSTEHGTLTATGTTGAVTLGGTLPDGTSCAADTIPSLVTISGTAGPVAVNGLAENGTLTLSGNTGGVTLNGITLSGLAYVQNNTGTAPITVSANKINGSLYCTGNTPAPGDNGAINKVSGTATGQCTALATR